MKQVMRIIIFLFLALLVSGCSFAPIPSPITAVPTTHDIIETPTPTAGNISIRLTERVGTVIALQTASTTPLPTLTAAPTQTPIPINLSDLTSIVQATQNPLFDKYCAMSGYRYFFNERWGVCDVQDNNFIVFSIDGYVWQFSYAKLGMVHIDLGNEYYTRVIYSTPDENYVYFAPLPQGYDPLGPFYGNGVALLRVNLMNGQIQVVLPNINQYYSISFSPTGRRMTYTKFSNPLEFVIQDLQSGELKKFDIDQKYTQAGEYVWASDGLKLAYKLIIDGDECSRKITVRLLDINDMSSTTIINDTQVNTCQDSDPTFYIDDVTDNSVLLEQHGDTWIYNIASKHLLLQATATPPP